MITCPRCQSGRIVKNGFTHNHVQNYKCKSCSRQFVLDRKHPPITQATLDLIDKLLLERISLRGIVRVTGVSHRWFFDYLKKKYAEVPQKFEEFSKQEVEERTEKKGASSLNATKSKPTSRRSKTAGGSG
ncbi:hypothetical protein DC3_12640 [Deinococcus cellulosilyticus NBRC 106333 = KACC 11606]|uniref:InsA N-terminal domain-containing protein n=1 Tax=Deinococcus cellulosilyticus (strain DSM 18568 / NBRC 106333 / KACC 11606 / 5516J-15) TaxID=1223518 RepID=A0A511MYJ1_DEIC1|nr:hypothetical protein DC3_12640 [Deinococcus cellulosilyticus NBRC 106333 = KACC 11606]